jgi:hypothetical protein
MFFLDYTENGAGVFGLKEFLLCPRLPSKKVVDNLKLGSSKFQMWQLSYVICQNLQLGDCS